MKFECWKLVLDVGNKCGMLKKNAESWKLNECCIVKNWKSNVENCFWILQKDCFLMKTKVSC